MTEQHEYRVLGEIVEGHVYAIGVPPDTSLEDITRHAVELRARTRAEIIVFTDGLSVVELESQALADAREARDTALREFGLIWEQHETYRREATALHARLAEADQRAELLRRQVEDLTAELATANEDLEEKDGELGAEIAKVDQLLDEQKRFRAEILRMHEEAATFRTEVERLRGLIGEVVKLDDDGYLLCGSPLLARIQREAGLT